MFEAFLITLIIVGWCVSGFLLWRLLDGSKTAMPAVVVWCAASVFFVLYAGM